jgi:hypothetical protein
MLQLHHHAVALSGVSLGRASPLDLMTLAQGNLAGGPESADLEVSQTAVITTMLFAQISWSSILFFNIFRLSMVDPLLLIRMSIQNQMTFHWMIQLRIVVTDLIQAPYRTMSRLRRHGLWH